MKLIGVIGTAVLTLTLGAAVPGYAQEQNGAGHERDNQKQEHRDQPQAKPEQAKHEQAKQQAKPEAQHSQPQHESAQKENAQGGQQKQSPAGKPRQDNQAKQAARQNEQHTQQQQKPTAQQPQRPEHAQKQQEPQHSQQQAKAQHQRTPEQQHVQQAAWQQHRSQHWESDHRTWQQRGGYNGYRIPDDRFRGYFGEGHGFRIYGLPFLVVGGYPRFQYDGYWISMVDPYPESWAADWYDTDDVYVAYMDNGYYLFNRRYPGVGISISVSM